MNHIVCIGSFAPELQAEAASELKLLCLPRCFRFWFVTTSCVPALVTCTAGDSQHLSSGGNSPVVGDVTLHTSHRDMS